MKRHPNITRHLNAFLKHTQGRCPIIVDVSGLVPSVKCILEHRLASGICYIGTFNGKEIGSEFWARKRIGWGEVDPPGKPVPMNAPVEYVGDVWNPEFLDLMKKSGLFFYSCLHDEPEKDAAKFLKIFGDRYIPGLITEADNGLPVILGKLHKDVPIADRDDAYKKALAYMKKAFETEYVYGLSGSNVYWYQAAAVTKQKRWDHEIANGNFQVQAAFLRGVSQQHSIPFILYIAPMTCSADGLWGTKADPETPFGKVFNSTFFSGGKPDHLLERQWFCGWFSGPAAVVLEAAQYYLFRKGKDKDTFEPGCMAAAVKKLNHLAYESDFDRGVPCRPACILMDERHGWTLSSGPDSFDDPPRLLQRKIWGFFDFEQQDIMVDNFFGAIFPGYEKGASFGGGYGNLVQTPYGESFDVLMSNAGPKALKKYRVIFPLGRPKLTQSFRTKLTNYVSDGGTLVLNIRQVDSRWQEFLGVKFTPAKASNYYEETGLKRAGDWSKWLEPDRLWREKRYHYTRIETKKAHVLAVTEHGDPLIVYRKYGKGRIYLVTAHYMQECSGQYRPAGLLNIARYLIGQVLSPYQKLLVRGPEIQYMVNETSDGLRVLLLNNREDVWNGWIMFPGMGKATVEEKCCEEHVHVYKTRGDMSVRLNIPGYGLRLLSVRER